MRSTSTTHPSGCASWSSSATAPASTPTANGPPATATSTTSPPTSRWTTADHQARPTQTTWLRCAEDTTAPRPTPAGRYRRNPDGTYTWHTPHAWTMAVWPDGGAARALRSARPRRARLGCGQHRPEGIVMPHSRGPSRAQPGARPRRGTRWRLAPDARPRRRRRAGRASAGRRREPLGDEPEHLLRRRRLRPGDRRLVPGRRRLPAGPAQARPHHPRERRRRGRPPGGRAQHRGAGQAARLARGPARAGDLAVPAAAARGRAGALHVRRAGAGPDRGGGEHPPAVLAVRPLQGAARQVAGEGAGARAAAAGRRAGPRAARPAQAGRARDPGVPHRRLQQPLAPRLDPRRRRRPGGRALSRPLAGQRDAGRRRLRGLLPQRAPGPGRRPGLHLDPGRSGGAG